MLTQKLGCTFFSFCCRFVVSVRSSTSIVQLSELLTHKRERYMKCRRLISSVSSRISATPNSLKQTSVPSSLRGTRLIAHLHEHGDAITRSSIRTFETFIFVFNELRFSCLVSKFDSLLDFLGKFGRKHFFYCSMSVNAAGTSFASASSDGTIKIWSFSKFTGQLTGAIRADATYVYST